MKTKILNTIFLLCFFSISIFSQWTEQSSGVTSALNSVWPVDDNVAWICGAGGKVLRTTNAGANWVQVTLLPNSINLYCICGINADTAVVSGTSSTTYIYRTSDGGSSWGERWSQPGGFINAFARFEFFPYFIGALGNPVGGFWRFTYSNDYGISWDTGYSLPQIGSETGWKNSFCLADCYQWFGTNNSHLYFSPSCSSPPFIIQPTPGLTNSMSIWGDTSLTLLAGGEALIRSTNAGNNWSTVTAPGSGNILGITCIGNVWWYVRGSSIYRSTDNGINWVLEYTAPSGTYTHIKKSITGNRIWAIRNNGGISKSDGITGIKPLSNNIPGAFKLYQNYPNPFNPATNIKFEVPENSFVNLLIYDELGRLVTNLVNEHLKPGTYEVNWDASKYSSGIYYCKLITGTYNESRKMVLIK